MQDIWFQVKKCIHKVILKTNYNVKTLVEQNMLSKNNTAL